MTIKEVRELVKQWQDKLGLNDWIFKVRWAKKGELSDDGDGTVAKVFWFCQKQTAIIVIERGEGVHTIVHELLHVRLEGHLEQPSEYDPLYELALNKLADALVGKVEQWV